MLRFLFLFFFLNIFPNENLDKNYHWPVEAEKIITGSFGEFRYFHFHMGQDFATDSKNGLSVYALTDSKVVKIQNYRYSIGNAIILEHKDGFFSRYGHLTDFHEKVWVNIKDKTILEKRKKRIDFEYTLTKEEQVSFQRGEVIAYSGETGIGPSHLHLEIFKDNIYYNPADFGLNLNTIGDVKIYSIDLSPEDNKSFINGKNKILSLRFQKDNENKWKIIPKQKLKLQGNISVSISGAETSGKGNRIGFQKMNLFLNEKEIQEINFHVISNLHTHRSNFVMDNYKSRMNGKPFKYFLHSKQGNNLLGTKYKDNLQGLIKTTELQEQTNKITIKISGLKNTHELEIEFENDSQEYPNGEEKKFNISPDSYSTLASNDKFFECFFPAYSVFTKENFQITEEQNYQFPKEINLESGIYSLSPDYREFNLGYDLYLKTKNEMDPIKFGLYQIFQKGKSIKYISGTYINLTEKFFRIRTKQTGTFAILSDNSKPTLKIYKYNSGQKFQSSDFKLYLITSDIGSGIFEPSLKIEVDNEEVYNDLNPETGLRELFNDEKLKQIGKHILRASVKDKAGNESNLLQFEYEVLSYLPPK